MSLVWDAPLADSEKLVLLALADWSNDDGECWPSITQLSVKTGKSERTIQYSIRALCERGHLSRTERVGKGCTYRVHPQTPATVAPHPRKDCAPATVARVQGTTQTPATVAPNTSVTINPSTVASQPTKRVRAREPVTEVPNWIPVDAWAGWIDSRKAKPTARAIVLAIGTLEKLRRDGHDPGAVLDQSTLNGWRGLFALKQDYSDARSRNQPRSPSLAFLRYAETLDDAPAYAAGSERDRQVGTGLRAIGQFRP